MSSAELPPPFVRWFAQRGWTLRDHQRACLALSAAGRSYLLEAPTGAGKTLAGFLWSLSDLSQGARSGLHTLYVSPLKALAVDIARNVEAPVREMGLPISIETRTGDTPPAKKSRQRVAPPDILMTTPEQVALLLARPDAGKMFGGLRTVIVDELHALAHNKRGHLLSLNLARLRRVAPSAFSVGLSATVADSAALADYLWSGAAGAEPPAHIRAEGGAKARIDVHVSDAYVPWAGHSGRYAMQDIYEAIAGARMTLVFVNTRSQAEIAFQSLWRLNDQNLPIALHHGSLDVAQRRKVEAAMADGRLRAIVCTATLDLGIDWGDVDLVIQIGAPKGASRLTQRIGRANHRMDESSRALLVPGNRFETLECIAATEAVAAGLQDGEVRSEGGLDVLAQHVMARACAGPFSADDFYAEIREAAPYRGLDRATFDKAIDFVATGGYALKSYDRFRRIVRRADGLMHPKGEAVERQHRLNVGTIVDAASLSIRLLSGKGSKRTARRLGSMEEWYVEGLTPGDTFYFAGQVLKLHAVEGEDAFVTRAPDAEPKVPMWGGARFPLSTFLADRVRRMLHARDNWRSLPAPLREWLERQEEQSIIPAPNELLIETFPDADRYYLVAYPFEGRLAHQTLGMLITRRLERAGAQPLGFVPTDYSLSVFARKPLDGLDFDCLFDEDMLGDDLEAWLQQSVLMKRSFRDCAVIAGLIERRHPGARKTARQVTFSTDLIFDVLRQHEPEHLLLKAAWNDAAAGYLDIARLQALLTRVKGRLRPTALDRPSPLAIPVMREINKEPIVGEAQRAMLREASILESEGRAAT